ncbi:hypothetical protein [Streptomyces reticuli]|uniref:hypothetical protein n=1 Tax=Streptomyces reticuli TaxID=1926 RepID=UPI00073DC8F0|nr:hypothetical protein [Streptomyces sp. SID7810]CUW29844.1 hypothetical protein TUE45_04556 [Streptomyces reticuli]
MYGHGAVPPPRSAGKVISLRVMFAAAGALTCGLLSCLPLFRAAFVRGRWYDWLIAWLSLPLSITGLAVVGELPEEDWRSDLALGLLLLLGVVAAIYYLVVDIRVHQQQRFAGYAPAPAPTVHGPYGFGHAAPSPYATTLGPGPQPPVPPAHHTPIPQPPHGVPVVPPAPVPRAEPPQQRPAPARIDQVCAELDELSDYLRRQDGRDGHDGRDSRGEGGR